MKYSLPSLLSHEFLPGLDGKMIHTERMTLAFWDVKEGSQVPEHSHPHEQVLQVIQGDFHLTIGEEQVNLHTGDVYVIQSGSLHSGIALTDCKLLDVFCPVRSDYVL